MINEKTLPQAYYSLVKNKSFNQPARQFRPGRNEPFITQTHGEFWKMIEHMGAGLITLGVKRGDTVAIIADNCPEWMVVDFAVLSLGALDVPRGSDTTDADIAFILNHCEAKFAFAETSKIKDRIISLRNQLPFLNTLVCIENSLEYSPASIAGIKLYNFQDVLTRGKVQLDSQPDSFKNELKQGKRSDSATIIYTSGTTGEPKGVELTHESFLFQIERINDLLYFESGFKSLNALPVWHAFERAVEYILFFQGGCVAHSKLVPTILLKDISETNPHYLSFVPRVWENIRNGVFKKVQESPWIHRKIFSFFYKNGKFYRYLEAILGNNYPNYDMNASALSRNLKKIIAFFPYLTLKLTNILGDFLVFSTIRKRLGKSFVCGISGGSALPASVEEFYRIAGMKVIQGYGLTELGPIINVNSYWKATYGTVGSFLRDIKYKVVGENGKSLRTGEKGELWVKTPQIMRGYYKRPDLTAQAITEDCWFKTGDLVRKTVDNKISIVGRIKDTIVLRSGKNVEPDSIEKAMLESHFIETVVLVGQDQEYLGALVVPNFEYLEKHLKDEKKKVPARSELVKDPSLHEFYKNIIQDLISSKNGFKPYERIVEFTLLGAPFEVNREMTPSLKVKRNIVAELYAKEISSLFEREKELV